MIALHARYRTSSECAMEKHYRLQGASEPSITSRCVAFCAPVIVVDADLVAMRKSWHKPQLSNRPFRGFVLPETCAVNKGIRGCNRYSHPEYRPISRYSDVQIDD
jgi:hypothetical protein